MGAARAGFGSYRFKGRIYVVGSPEMHASFEANRHPPYTRTLPGAGPNGETVGFQVDKKDPALVERPVKTFQSQARRQPQPKGCRPERAGLPLFPRFGCRDGRS